MEIIKNELDSVQMIPLSRIEVSLYRDVTSQTPMRSVCLEEVANWVKGKGKNGQFLRRQTEEIRQLKAEGKVDEAGKLKKKMPAITPNAEGRKTNCQHQCRHGAVPGLRLQG